METLKEVLERKAQKNPTGQGLQKHLEAVEIYRWEHIARHNLYRFVEHLGDSVAPSSAKTMISVFKGIINRYQDIIPDLPTDWKAILVAKAAKPVRTFLNPKELQDFELVSVKSATEKIVKIESLLEAYTGARVSDILELTEENYSEGAITYVSKKTNVRATVPVSDKVREWIEYAQSHREDEPCLMSRNDIIRRLARRAGIDSPVTVFRAGQTVKSEKWRQLSSHSFRISFVTNLQRAGMDMLSISRLAGHTNTSMTERYCAPSTPKLTKKAEAYLGTGAFSLED